MTSWVKIVFNDEAGNPSGLWGSEGSIYGVHTLKTNDPEKALKQVFKSFSDRSFFISRMEFDSVTFKYNLPDGTRQKQTFDRDELHKKQLELLAFF
jgi:hypothetical protein